MNASKTFYQVKISGIILELNKNMFYENIQIFLLISSIKLRVFFLRNTQESQIPNAA